MTDATNLAGMFLIALPGMGDPRFKQAVIYICSHDRAGAMGIVINKQKGPLMLSDLLEQADIEGTVTVADNPVLSGGPVDIDRGFVLHSPDYFKEDCSVKLSETLNLTATRDVMEALVSDQAPSRAVLAVGYAGWGAGQLDKEIQDNAWLVSDPDPAIIFSENDDEKWVSAVGKMGFDPAMLSGDAGRA